MLKDALVQLVAAIILAGTPIIVAFTTGFLRLKVKQLEATLNEQQLAQLKAYTTIFAQAAEQLYGAGNGPAKKAWVIGRLQELANKFGWKLDVAEFEAALEAAIKQGLEDPVVFSSKTINQDKFAPLQPLAVTKSL